MSSLIIAFAMAIGLISLSVLTLSAFEVSKEIAVQVSAVILGFIPQFREYLDKRRAFSKEGEVLPLVSFQSFGLPMGRLVLYAWLLMFAAIQFSSLVSGMIFSWIPGIQSSEVQRSILVMLVIVIAFLAIFLTGRWIGMRYVTHGVIVVLLAVIITQFTNTFLDMIILSEEEYSQLFGKGKSLWQFLSKMFIGTATLAFVSLIGFWRGRKQKLSAYASYLLKNLPPEARTSMVQLLFEESRKLSMTYIPPAQKQPHQEQKGLPQPMPISGQALPAAVLVALSGPLRGRQFAVNKSTFRIGSNPDNDLVIKGDSSVSRYHAYLRHGQEGFMIIDQQSTNGTFVNDYRVREVPMTIAAGNRIRIGNSKFEVLPVPDHP